MSHTQEPAPASPNPVVTRTWAPSGSKTLMVTQGFRGQNEPKARHVEIQLRKFISQSQDAPGGQPSALYPPYAIDETQAAQSQILDYIRAIWFRYVLEHSKSTKNRVKGNAFLLILHTIHREEQHSNDRLLLAKTMQFWAICRMIEEPWQIHEESESPSDRIWPSGDTLSSRVPVAPVVAEQLNAIMRSMLRPIRSHIVKLFRKLVENRTMSSWLAVFLATFVLLNNYDFAAFHDHQCAVRMSLQVRLPSFTSTIGRVSQTYALDQTYYTDTGMLEKLHRGARALIQCCSHGCSSHWPICVQWGSMLDAELVYLDDAQRNFMRALGQWARRPDAQARLRQVRESKAYDYPGSYFAMQLFEV
ncbi:hypothetical protein F5Y19DRAFT_485216 [Xylariaceae sp. FL1651]|nr:hypothetical protein F5Y19DRAFT_485216 [Xylariaceae sp. FL1651]